MAIKWTILWLSILFSYTLYSQKDVCLKNIRTGSFSIDAGDKTVQIKRTKRRQIETYDDGRSKLVTKVMWVSDDEYLVYFLKKRNAPGCLENGDVMKVTILECTTSFYIAEITNEKCGTAQALVNILE